MKIPTAISIMLMGLGVFATSGQASAQASGDSFVSVCSFEQETICEIPDPKFGCPTLIVTVERNYTQTYTPTASKPGDEVALGLDNCKVDFGPDALFKGIRRTKYTLTQ